MTPSRFMLFRFSLYGFLKNQRYYEPFIILAFREKGLSFLTIGLLIGFRGVCTNLFQIPTGAIADLYGRRGSMIVSFAAYIVSFVIFALSNTLWMLFAAMAFYAVGESFRTGTHKAMIFEWLRVLGRQNEKTRFYGFTRSWSKIGSAVSAVTAAVLVFVSGRYTTIFWYSTVPYALNILNFIGYPKFLDGEGGEKRPGFREFWRFTVDGIRYSLSKARVRRLLTESMLFDGVYDTVKDYMQPVLNQLAMALPLLAAMPFIGAGTDGVRRSAFVVGGVYFVLSLLEGWASRYSHRVRDLAGGEEEAARTIWRTNLCVFALMFALMIANRPGLAAACFVVYGLIQNLFRPVQLARYDMHAPSEMGATVLSIESQAKGLFSALVAPALGYAVDLQHKIWVQGVRAFWPTAVLGILTCLFILSTSGLHQWAAEPPEPLRPKPADSPDSGAS